MRKMVYVVSCIILLCAMLAASAWILSNEGFSSISPIANDGEYIIHRNELVPREDITSFIVSGNKIYVFFDKSALVNVYQTDGSFVYGIQVSTIANGIGDIAVHDQKLYIWSRRSSIYVFQGDQLHEFVAPLHELDTVLYFRSLFEKPKSQSYNNRVYLLAENKNYIFCEDTKQAIVAFPQQSKLAESMLIVTLIFIALSLRLFSKIYMRER